MRYLLYLPAVFFFLLPLVYAMHESAAARRTAREKEEKRRAAAAAKEAAQHEKEKAKAARAVALPAVHVPARKRGRPRKCVSPEQRPETILPADVPAAPVAFVQPASVPAVIQPAPVKMPAASNGSFSGQVVAFTGTLPGMTRAEAIKAVSLNGGKAYENMPAATTILVVGDKPGNGKLEKADRWIASVRKITAAQFFTMLKQPAVFSPEAFADSIG